jgi:hypothetical protein
MKNDWAHWLRLVESALVAALFSAFFGIVAWRNRSNKFLFYGWLSVLAVFALIYVAVFVLALRRHA